MTAALAPAPTKMTRVAVPGRVEVVPFQADAPVSHYLKALTHTLAPGEVPVVGGRPVTEDTVVPENLAVTVAPKEGNG